MFDFSVNLDASHCVTFYNYMATILRTQNYILAALEASQAGGVGDRRKGLFMCNLCASSECLWLKPKSLAVATKVISSAGPFTGAECKL